MSRDEQRAADRLADAIGTLLVIALVWGFVVLMGAPWWAIFGGYGLVALWRGWQFWRAL